MTGSRRQLLEERQHMAALELTADDHIAFRAAAVGLKNRLGDVETDCRDRLHACLLRIVVTPSATTSVALTCPWGSRPQHHKRHSGCLSRYCAEARSSGHQVGCVQSLGEPIEDWSKQIMSFLALPPFGPEPGEVCGRAKLEIPSMLSPRRFD